MIHTFSKQQADMIATMVDQATQKRDPNASCAFQYQGINLLDMKNYPNTWAAQPTDQTALAGRFSFIIGNGPQSSATMDLVGWNLDYNVVLFGPHATDVDWAMIWFADFNLAWLSDTDSCHITVFQTGTDIQQRTCTRNDDEDILSSTEESNQNLKARLLVTNSPSWQREKFGSADNNGFWTTNYNITIRNHLGRLMRNQVTDICYC